MVEIRVRFSVRKGMALLTSSALAATAAEFHCDPARGIADGDGSASKPWRTVEEVLAARLVQMRGPDGRVADPAAPVKGGDTIWLHPGYHGALRIRSGFNERFITFAAATGAAAQVAFVEIGEGCRWRVRGLTVSPSLAPAPPARRPSSLVTLGERGGEQSAELVVEDCFIFSVADSSAWTARDWVEKPASGIWLGRHGRGHVARNNYVLNTRFGIDLCAPDCRCEGNVVDRFSGDGIRVTRDGQVVEYNVVKNNFAGAEDGDRNHDDGIQAFLFNAGRGTLRKAVVRGNLIVARDTPGLPFPNPLQGIGFFDGPLVDFVVEQNVVFVSHYHGISLYDAQGCQVVSNACSAPADAGKLRPWIMLGQKQRAARGNTVRDNIACSFGLTADPDVRAENNAVVTPEAFRRARTELEARIVRAFGAIHAVAGRPRLPAASGG